MLGIKPARAHDLVLHVDPRRAIHGVLVELAALAQHHYGRQSPMLLGMVAPRGLHEFLASK